MQGGAENKMDEGDFRTLKGYARRRGPGLTAAMEDYLEMICRCAGEEGFVRVRQLAHRLHVSPSSASKMAELLRKEGYVEYEKYAFIRPTAKGRETGAYLLRRHAVLERFLRYVNHSQDELEQVEGIEHFICENTVRNLEALLRRLEG